jgi:small neutral amino acid transporter SnatA (MarC family)
MVLSKRRRATFLLLGGVLFLGGGALLPIGLILGMLMIIAGIVLLLLGFRLRRLARAEQKQAGNVQGE